MQKIHASYTVCKNPRYNQWLFSTVMYIMYIKCLNNMQVINSPITKIINNQNRQLEMYLQGSIPILWYFALIVSLLFFSNLLLWSCEALCNIWFKKCYINKCNIIIIMHMVPLSWRFNPQFISAHLFLVYIIVSCDYNPLLDPGLWISSFHRLQHTMAFLLIAFTGRAHI